MMPDRLAIFPVAVLLFVPAVLLLDGPGIAVQLSLGLATALLLILFVRSFAVEPSAVVCAVLVATAGELLLSVVWGLYDYREALLPLYVPPGHGLFYALAAAAARHSLLLRHERRITGIVIVSGSILAAASLYWLGDVWGALWWMVALALMWRSHHRLLLSICFVSATLLEWIGTWLGNWSWEPIVPGLGIATANPPAGVGLLYVLLDLIVVALMRQRIRAPHPAPIPLAVEP
jgi:hypothetical protein